MTTRTYDAVQHAQGISEPLIRQSIQDAISLVLLNQTLITHMPDGMSRDDHEAAMPHYSWVHGLKYFRCHAGICGYIRKYVHAALMKQRDQDINECDALAPEIDMILAPIFEQLRGDVNEPIKAPNGMETRQYMGRAARLKINLYAHTTQGPQRWEFLRELADALNPEDTP